MNQLNKFKSSANAHAKKVSGINWTDNAFEKNYWLPLVHYMRPENRELQYAVCYFLLHFGKLSAGSEEDWRNTINILLMGLRDNNGIYILANEDDNKKGAIKSLPFNEAAIILVESFQPLIDNKGNNNMEKWFNWCLQKLSHKDGIAMLATYFGCLCLYLCTLITHHTDDVVFYLQTVNRFMLNRYKMEINAGRPTPRPTRQFCLELKVVFDPTKSFAKQIVYRLHRRRFELPNERKQLKNVKQIQNITCYSAMIQQSAGLVYWFMMASNTLKLNGDDFIGMLDLLPEFKPIIEVLRSALVLISKNGKLAKTWQICRILRRTAYLEWTANYSKNLIPVAAFVTIVNCVETSNNIIWNLWQFGAIKRIPGSIDLGIRIGKSIRNAVEFDRRH